MLVLTRRKAEQLVIGESVVIRVLEIRGQRVRLGVAAPEGVLIRRQELPPRPVPVPDGEAVVAESVICEPA